ncbi:MAG: DUF2341 domain-containing protein, partial [Candidatus Aenigmarchaeota archaeon]|nr:DUF2341 domain-containing protein [Candidatus Aenigmarchaeota archaeon]
TIELKQIYGNETYGIFESKWFVHSVEVGKAYTARIIAENIKGKVSYFDVEFYDDPIFCCRRQINGSLNLNITLNTALLISQGKMRSDCGDIRFTDSRSFDAAFWTRNFSYSLAGCNSATTRINISLPSGVTSFYVYYGNPSVTSISTPGISGWLYRITINNTQNSNTLTNYQVLVIVDTQTLISQGKMRWDCGDIRFTDSDGVTLLNYWLESGCGTTNTRIWVRVPSIPASSTKTIYMYYGNPSATSLSNVSATMFIYEDMETTPLGTLAGSAFYDSTNKWVRLTPVTTWQTGYLYYNFNPGSQGFYARFRFWAGGGNGADAVWLGVYDSSYVNTQEDIVNGGYHFTFDEYQDRICFTKSTVGNGAGISCASEGTIDNGVWHTAEVYYWRSGNTVCARIYYDGILKVDACDTSPQSNALNGIGQTIFGGRTGAATNEHRIDDIIVRKFSSPEPTTTTGPEEFLNISIGPEETWIRISGGGGNLLITGGSGNIRIK